MDLGSTQFSCLLWDGLDDRYKEKVHRACFYLTQIQKELFCIQPPELLGSESETKQTLNCPCAFQLVSQTGQNYALALCPRVFLPIFQILPIVQNRCTPIRQTCDWSLWSAPANDNGCVIYTFHSVIRRCIRSCLRE